jgi:hypothetical protein
MRKRMAAILVATAISSFGLVGVSTPAHACAEPDPTIGCIGLCARPLQGSPTCPPADEDPGNGNGHGKP